MANHSSKYQIKKSTMLVMLGLLLILLSGSRILWMEMFRDQKHEPIKNGQFDLRNWNAEDGEIVLLDGEWEFYPSQRLMDGRQLQGFGESKPRLIQVPEDGMKLCMPGIQLHTDSVLIACEYM